MDVNDGLISDSQILIKNHLRNQVILPVVPDAFSTGPVDFRRGVIM